MRLGALARQKRATGSCCFPFREKGWRDLLCIHGFMDSTGPKNKFKTPPVPQLWSYNFFLYIYLCQTRTITIFGDLAPLYCYWGMNKSFDCSSFSCFYIMISRLEYLSFFSFTSYFPKILWRMRCWEWLIRTVQNKHFWL